MKIRQGFISNSSSSSFVLIVDTEAYNVAREKAHPFTKEVLDKMDPQQVKINGTDLTVMTTYMGQGGDAVLDMIDYKSERPIIKHTAEEIEQGHDPEEGMGPFDALAVFEESLPKGSYFSHIGYN